MLVELAIGDAYGAGFEYCSPEFVARHHTVTSYVRHPTHLDLRPGDYTDDTQMSIAISEQLLSDADWTAENLADRFVQVFHRDERVGYSRTFRELLVASATGAEFRAAIRPVGDTSGAAMRAGPIGMLADVDEVVRHAGIQARVTHESPGGVESARAAALAVHHCYHRLGPTADAARWVEQQLRARGGTEDWSRPWRGPVGAKGVMSVRAALTALSTARSTTGLLSACVDYTGDVDTVAAVALAAGSCAADLVQDLPAALYAGLENGRYGRDHLVELDDHLRARFPRQESQSSR